RLSRPGARGDGRRYLPVPRVEGAGPAGPRPAARGVPLPRRDALSLGRGHRRVGGGADACGGRRPVSAGMSVRVLHVITRLTVGGSPENTVSTVVALDRSCYLCTLAVSFRESDDAVLEDARRRGCRLLDVPSLGREVALVADVVALGKLVRLIGAERPHIVHTHTSKAGFVGRLAARLARVPAVIHQPHGHVFYGYFGPRRTAVYTALERRAAVWCDRIITLTERGTEEHLARGIGRPAQYVTVPSGVPTARLRATAPSRPVARARLGVGAQGAFGECEELGIPVAGAAVGVNPAVIVDGECGRLVPPEDPAALARALMELGRDEPLRRKLGEAAIDRAEAFSTAVADAKMCAVYEALVREKRIL